MPEEHANAEMFEIVNDKRDVAGTAPRSKCHGDPSLAHRSVHVFVRNRAGEYFLQKRAMTKDVQPGKWDSSVGGHVAIGETYEQAAPRELQEELGVEPADATALRHAHDFIWRSPTETEHVRTYLLDHEGPFTLPPDEIDDGRFWSVEEIRSAVGTGVLTPNLEEELRRLGLVRPGGT